MRPALKCSLLSLLLFAADASAQIPGPLTSCTRSATLLACKDAAGNAYGVATVGKTIYLQGFEVIGKRYWAQTSSRYGQLTFFTGIASDGEAWVGYSRRVGWTTQNRFSSSGGLSRKFVCDRMVGC
ncbi:glutamine synthetase [Pseudomonas gingeri]|uniref:glutamine synthetase n=1 Tax=Pseudomonas gingeri TaxID=117681 RepID=UPI0015A22A09|nr:glutamine synthetase [Pseudomonas gingeri]NWA04125.1 glutamine synthetase [Pseudomonas gingeri]NWA15969.1 glutamine synthetase [Pseudomonas gingeri]NWA58295.1 glutamine synthetase [Pseudomonas gingeri]NWA99313.1 glutamine synthetase [Pseudomonas gingeri]NWB05902.1 glutamine synthetase [Pseudomonas gingeri]